MNIKIANTHTSQPPKGIVFNNNGGHLDTRALLSKYVATHISIASIMEENKLRSAADGAENSAMIARSIFVCPYKTRHKANTDPLDCEGCHIIYEYLRLPLAQNYMQSQRNAWENASVNTLPIKPLNDSNLVIALRDIKLLHPNDTYSNDTETALCPKCLDLYNRLHEFYLSLTQERHIQKNASSNMFYPQDSCKKRYKQ